MNYKCSSVLSEKSKRRKLIDLDLLELILTLRLITTELTD